MIELENFTLSADTHAFNVSLASKIGLIEAIILQHFYYWHQGNKNNESMIKDGRVWVFRSFNQIAEDYPYLSRDKVRGAIDRLEKAELIIKADYNTDKFKRACWYSLSDISLSIFFADKTHAGENPTPCGKIPRHVGKSHAINYNNKLYKDNINNNSACAREEEYIEAFGRLNKYAESAIILHITLDESKALFDQFIKECQFSGQTHEDESDFNKHFLRYARIALQKRGDKPNASTTPQEPQRKVISNSDILEMMNKK